MTGWQPDPISPGPISGPTAGRGGWPPPANPATRSGPCECGGWQSCACAVPVAELRLLAAQLADLHGPAPHPQHALDVSRCRAGEPLVTCPLYRRLSRLNGLRLDRDQPPR